MDPEQRSYHLGGYLDAAARIYPTAVTVAAVDPQLRDRLVGRYGGTLEPSRWVVKGRRGRMQFLRAWLRFSRWRTAEIRAALAALETAEGDLDL